MKRDVSRIVCSLCYTLLSLAASSAWAADAPAQWISGSSAEPEKPAPVLFKDFRFDAKPESAVFSVAVAGWCEVYVNGEKVGRDVLTPVVCQPDRRVSSLSFDVTALLKVGDN